MPRDYDKERRYDGKPSVKKKRAARNRARRKAEACGKNPRKGYDVDHKDGDPQNNKCSNLRVVAASKNRSYPRTKTARKKS